MVKSQPKRFISNGATCYSLLSAVFHRLIFNQKFDAQRIRNRINCLTQEPLSKTHGTNNLAMAILKVSYTTNFDVLVDLTSCCPKIAMCGNNTYQLQLTNFNHVYSGMCLIKSSLFPERTGTCACVAQMCQPPI